MNIYQLFQGNCAKTRVGMATSISRNKNRSEDISYQIKA